MKRSFFAFCVGSNEHIRADGPQCQWSSQNKVIRQNLGRQIEIQTESQGPLG